jgi:hypothetical protein
MTGRHVKRVLSARTPDGSELADLGLSRLLVDRGESVATSQLCDETPASANSSRNISLACGNDLTPKGAIRRIWVALPHAPAAPPGVPFGFNPNLLIRSVQIVHAMRHIHDVPSSSA